MFKLILSHNNNYGIGDQNKIPWKCSEDMKFFRETTINQVVIMGRKTFESIGTPLKDRVNIVISRVKSKVNSKVESKVNNEVKDNDVKDKINNTSVIVCHDPYDAVRLCNREYKDKSWFVIGGSEIYRWFMEQRIVSELYATHIDDDTDCDTKFDYSGYMPILRCDYSRSLATNATLLHYSIKNKEEQSMLDTLSRLVNKSHKKDDRTGVGTQSLFGERFEFDLTNNTFPLMTTRKMFMKGIFEELMLYIRGQTDSKILENKGVHVWAGNTTREFLDNRNLQHLPVGDMGPSYGFLFRHFGAEYKTCESDYTKKGVDQLAKVINTLKTSPYDRRMIISLWDPTNLDNCPLPPCLYNYQFYCRKIGDIQFLDCMMTQRSSDFMVAGGWNVATGALLTYLIANVCDMQPGKLIWNIGDCHLYNNLIEQAKEQISRSPNLYPKIFIKKKENIESFEYEDIELLNYHPQSSIKVIMNA